MGKEKTQIVVTPLLRGTFLFDAISTEIFALTLLFFANRIGSLAGVNTIVTIRIVGIGSVFPTFFSFWAARRKILPKNLVLLFAIMCVLWVLGSIVLIVLVPFTNIGIMGISVVAFLVTIVASSLFYFYFSNH
ncbi:hypothetical protein MK805_02475 [Shimazuella sp. AN120528]|uniref:hypothetical protein n=1 Tax=Shimazuella soli TaxID=1892854 RepID=UPI001F0E8DED|nr:hypothetical protein [Shimazuella soli]MCH5583832.1 hypothetical protein [Shimazuella soli]